MSKYKKGEEMKKMPENKRVIREQKWLETNINISLVDDNLALERETFPMTHDKGT